MNLFYRVHSGIWYLPLVLPPPFLLYAPFLQHLGYGAMEHRERNIFVRQRNAVMVFQLRPRTTRPCCNQ
ncbi:hypothetical protein K402DRAFT_394136 [Aulographum hederae CBS 113979]|uniref:Uncharacterized protein n=1 Tax=Aulographum hederae CBS 113979 TaxID=1176131 RepID=A0A6G1GZA1_9PEZI|nr:hypothetical protein K402DRAFT_394136 [Aulographum hederae CBS 113979]